MKIIIEESEQQEDVEIIIKCAYLDASLQKLIAMISNASYTFKAEKEGKLYQIALEDIHYFESVDDQTYLYTKDDVYQCDKKLYELETLLEKTRCVRISKACIVNIECLIHVRPLFDGKFEAVTSANEILTINRHYVKAFKEAFGL